MSRFRHRSPRLRYLRARLSIFTRPSFLAALVFLSCLGFVVKEYWTNPDFLKFAQNQEAPSQTSSSSDSSLSDEDRAIAADIDNLSVLDFDKQQANIPITTNLNDSKKIKQQNEAQLNKILDLAEKSQKADEIKLNTTTQTTNTPSTSQQNPFLKQAKDLLNFKFDTGNINGNVDSLSPFSTDSQTPQNSFNLGVNKSQSANPESALQKAINDSNKNNQIQENSAENNSTDKKTFGQLPQYGQKAPSPDSSTNQNQTDSLVNTNLFNQPLNNPSQNPYGNFNNNQFPANNYTQPGLNNQSQNPYGNFNNTQVPANNYTQPGLNNQYQNPYGSFNNNQFPANNYTQPGLNNQSQNPYGNTNNQLPGNNNFNNNPQQNPYSNFNNTQVTGNQVQNPYNNFNNTQPGNNEYSPQTQTRINNAYNRLINQDFTGAATPNNYTAPNNNINTGFQQPNVQQFNSTYSPQNQIQYPNNGYGY
ncbi:MAG: hypothetical protein WBA07_03375 [Rivularia sp. (in: cyanobacteria)]